MKRIVVIGNTGNGKSTLSRILGEKLELPVYHLDKLIWQPGWQPTPAYQFAQQHRAIVAQDAWIIDGLATWDSVLERIAAADTIVFPDYPLWQTYFWACKRQVEYAFRPRPDLPPRCPMLPKTKQLLQLIWLVHQHIRPQILDLLREQIGRKRVVYLRTVEQATAFLNHLQQ
jgi:adenylate kinase family enzyme